MYRLEISVCVKGSVVRWAVLQNSLTSRGAALRAKKRWQETYEFTPNERPLRVVKN